ncbi:unnamed protein product [Merluccius merluccius]
MCSEFEALNPLDLFPVNGEGRVLRRTQFIQLKSFKSDLSSVTTVVLSVLSKTISVRTRLGDAVLIDCQFWMDPSSPLSASGFAVEWRYQFRGDGRLVLAYDGKTDPLADAQQEGATLDFTFTRQEMHR